MRLNSFVVTAGLGLGLLMFAPGVASASYLGPGLGMGLISTALGILGAILMALVAVLWYPVKHLWRRLRRLGAHSPLPPGRRDKDV